MFPKCYHWFPGTLAPSDTTLDLYVSFDQRQLHENSRDLTTFTTPLGAFRLTVLPMGWTNSPAVLQGDITHALRPEIPHCTQPFIDDVPIKGPKTRYELLDGTYETIPGNPGIRHFVWEHLESVHRVIQRVKAYGATFSGKKAFIGVPEIQKVPSGYFGGYFLKELTTYLLGNDWANCFKTHNKLTMYPLGKWPLAPSVLDQHLAAGRIRESSSEYCSPSFLIPKADPTVLPRWVNDFRALNENTIPDHYPLPRIETILSDCAKGMVWAKIDMTNSFFQTRVHPYDIRLTAVMTPFGLYEWVVMPMGCKNAPATHQRRMNQALRKHIGVICHVYLDDIVIWSGSIEEHRKNVQTVLQALRDADLYCSTKKSQLFTIELDFLGHHISSKGIEPDGKKVEKIREWPAPHCTKDVRKFLGLVQYLATFLPRLAEHRSLLTPLTTKEAQKDWPGWTNVHQTAFQNIKGIVEDITPSASSAEVLGPKKKHQQDFD